MPYNNLVKRELLGATGAAFYWQMIFLQPTNNIKAAKVTQCTDGNHGN